MPYSLAIDIGASSGRFLISEISHGVMHTEEVYRFENGMSELDGHLVWDTEKMFGSIIEGLKTCKRIGKVPSTLAIDTWGVDYVLLDENGAEILPAYAYRDGRTQGIPEKIYKIIPEEELYERCGIPRQSYNTIFQLYSDLECGRLENAKDFLFTPEYISYKLTGRAMHEYTIASTGGLLNAENKDWDFYVIEKLGLNPALFGKIYPPCTLVGNFTNEVKSLVGFDCEVVFAPSHDTASAVSACPTDTDGVFISSGTWSLVGTENKHPVTTKEAMAAGLTNEGGINYRFRFLKNIMGMWLFQSIRRELGGKYSYDELMHMAMESTYEGRIDPRDERFTAPKSMISEIRAALGEPNLPISDILRTVYLSLADSYAKTIREIEKISNKKVSSIRIVGGGSRDEFLNSLTAKATNKTVYAGPIECSGAGNLLSQFMYLDKELTLKDAREIIKKTYESEMKAYKP